jgi:hypothetical protein
MDIWDDQYFTDEERKEFFKIINKQWIHKGSLDSYYERLAVFWDSIGDYEYARDCRALIKS